MTAPEDESRILFLEAVAHHQAGRRDDAERGYREVLARNPRVVAAHNNLGLLIEARGNHREAEQSFRAALKLNPEHAEALNNLGTVLRHSHQYDEAQQCFRRALSLRGDTVETLINLADMLREQRIYGELPDLYARARNLAPNDARIPKGLARYLVEIGKLDEAIETLEGGVSLEPESLDLRSELVLLCRMSCDWSTLDEDEPALLEGLRAGKEGLNPFLSLAIGTTVADQFDCAQRYAARMGLARGRIHAAPLLPRTSAKIRIGYLSCDFREHPTAHLMVDMIERHDRSRFEVIGYASGFSDNSPTRDRLEKAFDRFTDLHTLSDRAAAAWIEQDRLDILIDVSGYTKESRLHISAFQPAPIQVSYLAYPGTMGMPAFDYIIADATVLPVEHSAFFSEKPVYLPHSYQVNDSARKIDDVAATRVASGLPQTAFVFCCFNSSYKITPQFFDIWMRLLSRVPGSVLWLMDTSPVATANLRQEAAARGLDADRLVFAPRIPLAQHLARHRLADLFLDTLPYNAHTTLSDALWAGLPAVTCLGETFAGRVGASVLRAANLAELVATDLQAYEDLALTLATSRSGMDAIRKKLSGNLAALPLFDCARYTRDIEEAYERMVELHQSGRPPESIAIGL